MKVALIPPANYESYALLSGIQLVLAQELERPVYRHTFVETNKRLRGPVILDNGAAEGVSLPYSKYAEAIELTDASEVILPDVMDDPEGTIKSAQDYLDYHRQSGRRPTQRFMIVLHGRSLDDIWRVADFAAKHYFVTTVGLPRILFNTLSEAYSVRIELANRILQKYEKRFKIHFLGANGHRSQEVRHAARESPHVRSIDTSLPFVFTMKGLVLGSEVSATRPPGYFQPPVAPINRNLLHYNIRTYLRWAGAYEKTS